jgi:hypothetical protein
MTPPDIQEVSQVLSAAFLTMNDLTVAYAKHRPEYQKEA